MPSHLVNKQNITPQKTQSIITSLSVCTYVLRSKFCHELELNDFWLRTYLHTCVNITLLLFQDSLTFCSHSKHHTSLPSLTFVYFSWVWKHTLHTFILSFVFLGPNFIMYLGTYIHTLRCLIIMLHFYIFISP